MNTQNQKRNTIILILTVMSICFASYGVKLPSSLKGLFHSTLSGLGYDTSGHTGFAREEGSNATNFKADDLMASGSLYVDGDAYVNGSIVASVGSVINNHAALTNLGFSTSGHTGFASSAAIPNNGSFTLNGLSEKDYTNLTNKPTSASWTLAGLFEKAYESLTGKPTSASWTHSLLQGLDYASSGHTGFAMTNGSETIPFKAEYYDFQNASTTNPAYHPGRLFYDKDNNVLAFYPDVNGPVLQIGQELWVRAKNNTGATIYDGQAVYISSATTGIHPDARLAIANATSTADVIALATHNITDGQFGYFTISGIVRGLNTSAYTPGCCIYLSQTTPGSYTSTAPSSGISVAIGHVTMSHSSEGAIFVRPMVNGSLVKAYFANGIAVNGAASATTFYGDGSNLTGIVSGVSSFSSLNDVSTSTGYIGKFLQMSGNKTYTWADASGTTGTMYFSGLIDVSTDTGNIGKYLKMTGNKTYAWENASGAAAVSYFKDLLDVSSSSANIGKSLYMTATNTYGWQDTFYSLPATLSCFIASCTMSTTYANSVISVASFGATDVLDNLNEFSSSSFTASKNYPKYHFNYTVTIDGPQSLMAVLYKNGVMLPETWTRQQSDTGLDRGVGASVVIPLMAGDVITLRLSSTGPSSAPPYRAFHFSGYEIPDATTVVQSTAQAVQTHIQAANSGSFQTLPDSTATFINYNTEYSDTLGEFNTTTGEFIPTNSGRYSISALVQFDAFTTGIRSAYITVNGVVATGSYDQQGGAQTGNVVCRPTVVLSLNAGDIVKIKAYQNSGGNLSVLTVPSYASGLNISRIPSTDIIPTIQHVNTTEVTVIASDAAGQQSITAGSWVQYAQPIAESVDVSSEWSGATFTSKINQKIQVTASIRNNLPISSYGIFAITKTPSSVTSDYGTKNLYVHVQSATSNGQWLRGTKIFDMKAGETLSLYCYGSAGGGPYWWMEPQIEITRLNTSVSDLASLGGADTLVMATKSSNQSLTNSTWAVVTGLTESKDAYGEFDGATFTSRISQNVMVSISGDIAASSGGTWRAVGVSKNHPCSANDGGIVDLVVTQNPNSSYNWISGTKVFSLNTGDTLSIGAFQDSGGSLNLQKCSIQIVRLNPPGTTYQTTSDKVYVKAIRTSNDSIANATQFDATWDTEKADTHGAFASNVFTAPRSDYYTIIVSAHITNSSSGTGSSFVYILKNGTTLIAVEREVQAASEPGTVKCMTREFLNQGDTIKIQYRNDSGGGATLSAYSLDSGTPNSADTSLVIFNN